MSSIVTFLLLLSSLALLTIAYGEGRAPHGIAYENPTAFSPSAYEFFHPKTRVPGLSPTIVTLAQMGSAKALESKVSAKKESGHRLGAGGIAGLIFGLAFVVLLAMGVCYVLNVRQTNANRAGYVQSA
ncbi:uncharacterized protein LOC120214570 [Hibiscus syriacus]|uniref:uncharacterized protein LOC120214570 n=1 Tax=Hibiscus syriacus TaxID=106335 RepID=UPI001922C300|nr:uncharacterized protein LOC120214570 [Hibiscus syriacus]